jgi:hypothetical protein
VAPLRLHAEWPLLLRGRLITDLRPFSRIQVPPFLLRVECYFEASNRR